MLNNTEPGLRNKTGYANLNIHIKQEMGKISQTSKKKAIWKTELQMQGLGKKADNKI